MHPDCVTKWSEIHDDDHDNGDDGEGDFERERGRENFSIACVTSLRFYNRRNGPTNGRTDRRTDGRTDGRTDPLIEMRGRI